MTIGLLYISSNILSILGILSAFGTTVAFAAGPISESIALDWADRKPSKMSRFVGFLFNINNHSDVTRMFLGGTFEEIQKNTDSSSSIRGFIWAVFTMIFFILATIFNY